MSLAKIWNAVLYNCEIIRQAILTEGFLKLEDDFYLLLESGNKLILEITEYFTLESGTDHLITENGDTLLMQ